MKAAVLNAPTESLSIEDVTVDSPRPDDVNIEIPGRSLLREKKLQGSSMGSNRYRIDMRR